MAFSLNFHHPQRPIFLAPLWSRITLFLLALGTLTFVLLDVASLFGRQEQLENRAAALQQHYERARTYNRKVTSPQDAVLLQTERVARARLEAPWELVFTAVERRKSDDIALLSMVAEQSSHEMLLKGESRTIGSLKIFTDGLSRETVFEQVNLNSYKPQDAGVGSILFEIRAIWH